MTAMLRMHCTGLALGVSLVGCAAQSLPAAVLPSPAPVATHHDAPRAEPALPTTSPSSEAIAVQGTAPDPLAFTVNGRSDLPPGPPSSAVPLAQAVEAAAGPLRPALAECLRPAGLHGRQGVRVTITPDGALQPMNPQRFAVSPAVSACLVGVLRAGTVEPAPPRAVPWDLAVDVPP